MTAIISNQANLRSTGIVSTPPADNTVYASRVFSSTAPSIWTVYHALTACQNSTVCQHLQTTPPRLICSPSPLPITN